MFICQVPHVLLQLSSDPGPMARGFYSMYASVLMTICEQSARENEGDALYLERVPAVQAQPEAAADPRFQELFFFPRAEVAPLEHEYNTRFLFCPRAATSRCLCARRAAGARAGSAQTSSCCTGSLTSTWRDSGMETCCGYSRILIYKGP